MKELMACPCPKIYKPVCGKDGNTYANACIAKCKNVDYKDGECSKSCTCMEIFKPVCGRDGIQYGNACKAKCKNVDYKDGPCPKTTKKPITLDGVRTRPPKQTTRKPIILDGVKTGPPNVTPKTAPPNVTPCPCPKINRPVCGNDGNQYPNSCIAKCKKVDFKNGPCKTAEPKPTGSEAFCFAFEPSTNICLPQAYSRSTAHTLARPYTLARPPTGPKPTRPKPPTKATKPKPAGSEAFSFRVRAQNACHRDTLRSTTDILT